MEYTKAIFDFASMQHTHPSHSARPGKQSLHSALGEPRSSTWSQAGCAAALFAQHSSWSAGADKHLSHGGHSSLPLTLVNPGPAIFNCQRPLQDPQIPLALGRGPPRRASFRIAWERWKVNKVLSRWQ